MNSFEIIYYGDLRTSVEHLDSGATIKTDAPKDNHGLGQSFSPTDLVCASLASCMLTIMAIAIKKHNVDIKGTTANVNKKMSQTPRMISQIDININFPINYPNKIKNLLERSAINCPVHKSLSEKIKKNINFIYPK